MELELRLYRGVWCAVWWDRGTRRRSLRTKDRGAAERAFADLKRSLAIPRGTIAEILDAYMIEKAGKASIESIRHAAKPIRAMFAHLRPDQVDKAASRVYAQRRRRDGRQNGTIIKELSVLRAALRWHDPKAAGDIEMPPAPAPRNRSLTRAEYARLKDAAGVTPHLRLFIVLALATAGRASAILELTWERVDFARGLIHLNAEGGGRAKGRATVPMTEQARVALTAAKRGAVTDYVIEYAGRRVRSVKKAFARAVERAALRDVSPHVLRHTAAVWLAEAGVSMPEIAAYLGHSDSRISERVYAKFSPTYLKRAAAALE